MTRARPRARGGAGRRPGERRALRGQRRARALEPEERCRSEGREDSTPRCPRARPPIGPAGSRASRLPDSRPVRSLLLTMTGVVERDGAHHGCVSEVRLFPAGARRRGRAACRCRCLPEGLCGPSRRISRRCSRRCSAATAAELGARVHFPLGWDVPEQTVRAPGGSVTPMTHLTFRNASELAKTCRERPRELPRPSACGTTVRSLLESLVVEAPSRGGGDLPRGRVASEVGHALAPRVPRRALGADGRGALGRAEGRRRQVMSSAS